MNDKPLVSIVVPVYNVEEYVIECVDSLLSQTYDNIETIIIDDGSPDNSYEKCRDKYGNLEKVKIIQQKNAGVSAARNTGIDNAHGEYLLFVDSDDVICKNCVETLVNAMQNHNVDLVNFVRFNIYNYDDTKKYINKIMDDRPENYQHLLSKSAIQKMLTSSMEIGLVELFKKDIIKNNDIKFRPGIKHNEDKLFKIEYLLYSKNVLLLNQDLYGYRVREDSVSHAKLPKAYSDILPASKKMSEAISKSDMAQELYKYAMYNEHETMLAFLRQIGKNHKVYKEWKEKYNEVKKDVITFDTSSFADIVPTRSKLEKIALRLPFFFYRLHIATYYKLLNIRTRNTR